MKKFRFQSLVGAGIVLLFCLNIILLLAGILSDSAWLIALAILVSAAQMALHDIFRRKNSMLRNHPAKKLLNHFISRLSLALSKFLPGHVRLSILVTPQEHKVIIHRARNLPTPIVKGSLSAANSTNAEYILHSPSMAEAVDARELRVRIGSSQCSKPYEISLLNIGPLNQKALSNSSILAICNGANISGCAVNTGRGGISPYLIRGGCDLVWQIAHEDYAFRKEDSSFNEQLFEAIASRPYIKMVEVVLPRQDATILKRLWGNRMTIFLDRLRHLSGGKPTGIRVFNPANETIDAICKSMWETRLHLDFVTIDGSLSADGFDPLNVSQARAVSHLRALSFFRRSIEQYELETTLIASGNIVTEYDVLKSVALGADACYCMAPIALALGNPIFRKLAAQQLRVANFHRNTLEATAKLMRQCGYGSLKDVNARDFFLTSIHYNIKSLQEIYFNEHPVKGPHLFTGLG